MTPEVPMQRWVQGGLLLLLSFVLVLTWVFGTQIAVCGGNVIDALITMLLVAALIIFGVVVPIGAALVIGILVVLTDPLKTAPRRRAWRIAVVPLMLAFGLVGAYMGPPDGARACGLFISR